MKENKHNNKKNRNRNNNKNRKQATKQNTSCRKRKFGKQAKPPRELGKGEVELTV